MTRTSQDQLFERARKTIRDLREKLSAVEAQNRQERIAVIGVGIRFPGSGSDLERFWQMIVDGRDAITRVPSDRWDREAFYAPDGGVPGRMNTRHAAFLDELRRFDADFFDISPREAVRMDPQQRLFLETAWHALEHAGIPRAEIAGTDAAVFIGVHTHSTDYQAMQFGSLDRVDSYSASGTAHEMISARLAYWLDLHGPSMAVNTACSSSLAAVHLACRALQAGESSLAIVGGVNLLLKPTSTVAAAQLDLLSPDGRCKTFDASADGMGRGEGCGVVVLKGLTAARRDGDRILAVIRGSAMNQDGKTNGLTAPNGLAQRRVLRQALADADLEPWQISYVEAHGTGTTLGDPIEVEALAEVLEDRRRTAPCTLGAVKANIGHLEGAAGIAGLIKTVLAFQHRWLPPIANLQKLNPHLPDLGEVLRIPQRGREWTASGPRFAGVSSFGWSGTNVHVLLEEEAPANVETQASVAAPLLVTAQSAEALRLLAVAYAERLEASEDAALADIVYTSAVRRTHHAYRIAVRGGSRSEIACQLRQQAKLLVSPSHTQRVPVQEDGHGDVRAGSDAIEALIHRWRAGDDVNWAEMFPVRGRVTDLPRYPFQGAAYWLDLSTEERSKPVSEPTWRKKLESLPAETRLSALQGYLCERVAGVLGPAFGLQFQRGHSLTELGLDSLKALQLKNDLQAVSGIALAPNFFFEHKTLSAASTYLDAKLAGAFHVSPVAESSDYEELTI